MRGCLVAVVAALALALVGGAEARTPILGESRASVADAQAWARANGATQRFDSLATLYWRLAPPRGIRPEVAYAQAAKETGFGRFGGVVDPSFHNPCGLKTTAGGANHDPGAHKRFPTWRVGVTAHLDHLALYAGAPGYPRARTPDPRHFPFLRARARSIQALGGAWAPSPSYGRSVAQLVHALVGRAPAAASARERPSGHFALALGFGAFIRAIGVAEPAAEQPGRPDIAWPYLMVLLALE